MRACTLLCPTSERYVVKPRQTNMSIMFSLLLIASELTGACNRNQQTFKNDGTVKQAKRLQYNNDSIQEKGAYAVSPPKLPCLQ